MLLGKMELSWTKNTFRNLNLIFRLQYSMDELEYNIEKISQGKEQKDKERKLCYAEKVLKILK